MPDLKPTRATSPKLSCPSSAADVVDLAKDPSDGAVGVVAENRWGDGFSAKSTTSALIFLLMFSAAAAAPPAPVRVARLPAFRMIETTAAQPAAMRWNQLGAEGLSAGSAADSSIGGAGLDGGGTLPEPSSAADASIGGAGIDNDIAPPSAATDDIGTPGLTDPAGDAADDSIGDALRRLPPNQLGGSAGGAGGGGGGGSEDIDAGGGTKEDDLKPDDDRPDIPSLTFDLVADSVYQHYPAIRQANAFRGEAAGMVTSARGEFDDKLEYFAIEQPLGFYENYRHGAYWKRPIAHNGGEITAGYRIGDGDFEPWYGERETDEGGEFKVAVIAPLLQNRRIDPRRTQLQVALLELRRSEPIVYAAMLQAQQEALVAYWSWVGAGLQLRIQQELLLLAEERVEGINRRIALGALEEIIGLDNERLLAGRQLKQISSDVKAATSAFKLSLYIRSVNGEPAVPPLGAVPQDLPPIDQDLPSRETLLSMATARRPELIVLDLDRRQVLSELNLAINQTLPVLDFGLDASQDVGGLTSSKGDKQPFKLEAALIGSVPVQRRKAFGKQRQLRAKLAQIDAKRQLTSDKIVTDIGQSLIVRENAIRSVSQSRRLVGLARQTLAANRRAFERGATTIIALNIYEEALADAESSLVLAEIDYFIADGLTRIEAGLLPGRDFSYSGTDREEFDEWLNMHDRPVDAEEIDPEEIDPGAAELE